jgi:hypothetical protein
MIVFRYVFLMAQERQGMPLNVRQFRKEVFSCFYGDDSIMSITDKVIGWFNQPIISELMSEIAHIYTDETKSKNITRNAKTLAEVNFLKRTFRKHMGLWYAPLSKETIEEMILWTTKKVTKEFGTKENIRAASMESWAHGEEYFNCFKNKVSDWCRTRGIEESLLEATHCSAWWVYSLTDKAANFGTLRTFTMKDALTSA